MSTTTQHRARPLLDAAILRVAIVDSLRKLHPRHQIRNPVMFVVFIGSILTLALFFQALGGHGEASPGFILSISLWLWFTVIFANFAEAMAEGRGKAQADALRKTRREVMAKVLAEPRRNAPVTSKPSTSLEKGDFVLVDTGDFIPLDGEVVDGVASVDESAVTGESAPVIRESGGDRSAVTGGTRVLSDWLIIRITSKPGESFIDRMIALVEGAKRQKTPNEIALNILLAVMTIIFLLVTATLLPYSFFTVKTLGHGTVVTVTVLVALLVCLIPTTIGGLLSAIGIAGMDRMVQSNVIAMSGRAVEAAGDVDVLLLDKTGTITLGNRQAVQFAPAGGFTMEQFADAAQLASLSDETPEGRSIVVLAKEKYGFRKREIHEIGAHFVPFSAQTRMSGVDLPEGRSIRKGSADAIEAFVRSHGGAVPSSVRTMVDSIARMGGTPLVVAESFFENGNPATDGNRVRSIDRDAHDTQAAMLIQQAQPHTEVTGTARVLGTIYLKDIVKGGIKERFAQLRRMGIKTVMITGDNPLTAATIAAEAGVDDFLAEATPEAKLKLIREHQEGGRLVAMCGDGTNDAPALAQADVAVAMNTGTQAAKEAGNMVDLDSNPTKLIEVVEIGKQLLITRGALTTFSIANDVSKYFAIIPAAFMSTYPALRILNVMKLATPQSAILSAVIFNALIIIFLVPLALRGVHYKAASASKLLSRNLMIYAVGGLLVPFVGIKLIDLLLVAMRLA